MKVEIRQFTIFMPILFRLTYYYKMKEKAAVDLVMNNVEVLEKMANKVPKKTKDAELWFVETVTKKLAGKEPLVKKTPLEKYMVARMMKMRDHWFGYETLLDARKYKEVLEKYTTAPKVKIMPPPYVTSF